MRILRLRMKNFRQYKDETIYFPQDGIIGIVGKNGAGKSTLFNAIGWCFYGKIKNVTNNMIKNQSAGKRDICFVEVDFIFQGKHHRVHRDLVSSRCFAEAEGVTVAVGTSNLNAYIEETLFKMDYKAFSVCYYAQQDEFDALAKAKPAERAQIISRLLHIEAIDKAAEEARKDYRALEKEVSESKRFLKDAVELEENKKKLENEATLLLKQIKEKEKEISKNEDELKNYLLEKSKGDKDFETFRGYKSTLENLTVRIETLKSSSLIPNKERLQTLLKEKELFEEIKHAITDYPKLNDQKEELSSKRLVFQEKCSIEKEIKEIKSNVSSYKKEYDAISEQLKVFEDVSEAILEKEKEQNTMQENMSKLRDQYNELNFSKKSKKEKLNELIETKTKFDELGTDAPCPTCERPLGEHYEEKTNHIEKEISSLEKEIQTIEEKIHEISEKAKETKANYQTITAELKELRKKEIEQNKLNERKSNMEKELQIRKKQYRDLNERYEKVKDVVFDETLYHSLLEKIREMKPKYEKAISIEKSLMDIEKIEEIIQKTESDILSYETEKKETNEKLIALAFDEESYRKLTEKIESIQSIVQHEINEKTKMTSEIRVIETKIQNIIERMKENEEILNEIKEKEEEMALLSALDVIYKRYKKDKLTKIAPALGTIVSDLMDLTTNGKYDLVELDEEYNIFIYRNGIKNPLSFYSGGEQKLAALCQRLAVSKILSNQTGQAQFEMLSMDEVFGSMDNERQDRLVETLRNLNQLFPQILCVSHSDNVNNMFDYILEVEVDKNNYSKASWETPWDVESIIEQIESYDNLAFEDEQDILEEFL